MTKLSWADVAVDKDYDYATTEIFNRIYEMKCDGADPMALACALLERAQGVMNYQTPWDGKEARNLHEDEDFVQINRLMSFMDHLADFAEKRLALVHGQDQYMKRKIAQFERVTKRIKIVSIAPEDIEYQEIIDMVEGLEQDLIVQGIKRRTVAKTLIDGAFVFAKKQPVDAFIQFCCDLKLALGRDIKTDMKTGAKTFDNKKFSDVDISNIHISEGSTSIH